MAGKGRAPRWEGQRENTSVTPTHARRGESQSWPTAAGPRLQEGRFLSKHLSKIGPQKAMITRVFFFKSFVEEYKERWLRGTLPVAGAGETPSKIKKQKTIIKTQEGDRQLKEICKKELSEGFRISTHRRSWTRTFWTRSVRWTRPVLRKTRVCRAGGGAGPEDAGRAAAADRADQGPGAAHRGVSAPGNQPELSRKHLSHEMTSRGEILITESWPFRSKRAGGARSVRRVGRPPPLCGSAGSPPSELSPWRKARRDLQE